MQDRRHVLYQMFWSPEALWQHPGVTSVRVGGRAGGWDLD
ncbi:hypothetical protein AK812_SmicGene48702, partial [Symbiodinium microadriaticum]